MTAANVLTLVKSLAGSPLGAIAFQMAKQLIAGGTAPENPDGSQLTAEQVDAAWTEATKPFKRIEDIAKHELGLDGPDSA